MTLVIDATNLIIGRIGTFVAKKALNGEEIKIINSEKAVISGKKEMVLKRYLEKTKRGAPLKGPYFPRRPDRLLKRTIRNMLPYKKERGQKALKRIRCYVSVPDELKKEKAETIKTANIVKTKSLKYVQLGELSKLLGAKF